MLSHSTYLQKVKDLKKKVYDVSLVDLKSNELLCLFYTISANILTYLPQIEKSKHFNLVQHIQFHRALSTIDQYCRKKLENTIIDDPAMTIKNSKNNAQVFVTYHTGSYRTFILLLSKEQVPFCLVTQEQFINEQGLATQQLYKEFSNRDDEELEILPSENPRLLFELMNRLKKGISVVFYIDGNTGVSSKSLNKNKNLLKIDFLNHHIYARQGIALLVYLSKAPLVTAIAKRDENLENHICIKHIETKKYLKDLSRTEFINTITKLLYGELECFLLKNFEQWEGWFYIHKFFDLNKNLMIKQKTNSPDHNQIFPTLVVSDQLHIFKYNQENFFLVQTKDYKIMKITPSLFELLEYFKIPIRMKKNELLDTGNQITDWPVIQELIDLNFLKQIA
ncbi:MAG: hypothetical protein CMC70_06015 [Flavobacteriaceae bacterium]|nr:hypothetical protein [Flavobacteriaceae bacterium]|tara:strand:+ start:274 stop:1455 length:1182 start_codon:yes stop_codon:yes gene_type:complete